MSMQSDSDKINPQKRQYKRAALAEERIISVLINHPDLIRTINANVSEEDFVTVFNKHIFGALTEHINEGKSLNMSAFGEELTPEEHGVLAGLEAKGRTLTNPKIECLESIKTLKEEKLKLIKPDLENMSDEEFRNLFSNN